MRLVQLHIQCPIYKLEKGGQGAHDIFRRGGIGLRRWGMWPIIISKGGTFSQQTNKTLKVHS